MICTRQEGSDSLQRAQSTMTNSCIQRLESESKFNPTREHKVLNRHEIKKPKGHKEDGASFPKRIQYMVSRIHPKISIPEKEEKEQRGRRRQGGAPPVSCAPTRERTAGAPTLPAFYPFVCCCPPFLSSPPSLPLKTRIPLSAEIKLEGP